MVKPPIYTALLSLRKSPMNVLSNLSDIEALEARPYRDVVTARTTTELIAQAAARFADRDAFRYLPNADLTTPVRRVNYRELMAQIYRAANLFAAMGVGPDDAVAILAPNLPETHYALWGAQVAARACPINYLLQADHIATLLKASHAKVMVALGPNEELDIWSTVEKVTHLYDIPVLQIRVNDSSMDLANVAVFQDQLARQSPEPDPEIQARMANCEASPQTAVVAFFHTGGTTGAPKLALHTHANEVHTSSLAPLFYGFDEHTVEINGFPLFHVAGAFVYGLAVLSVGGTQILPTLTGMRNAAFVNNYWKFCEREKVTALACVPTVLATLLNLPVDGDIHSVKVAYTGGSPLPIELAAQFERGLHIPVRNILGMTESAGLVCIEPFAAPRVAGSVGLRLPYTRVRVVRWMGGAAQMDDDCATGETGVVVIWGPHVSPGYSDAARNTGMFQILANGEHWLISGDLGHLDAQGFCHITGRAKDVIIRGSHNIDPGLVEDAFLAHPQIALCAVVGEPDAYAGELPVAFVTLKTGVTTDPALAARILAEVAPRVYERPAVPKRLTILETMPMTAVGKIFKPELRLRAMQVKLAQMLDGAVPGQSVIVSVEDRPAGPLALIRVTGVASDQIEANIRTRLAAVSVVHQIVFG